MTMSANKLWGLKIAHPFTIHWR